MFFPDFCSSTVVHGVGDVHLIQPTATGHALFKTGNSPHRKVKETYIKFEQGNRGKILIQLLGSSSDHRRAGFRRKLCGVLRSEKKK